MEKPIRIGQASALAAVVCASMILVTWLIAPRLIFFGVTGGIAAGFLSGYIAYDVGEFIEGVLASLRTEYESAVDAYHRQKNACHRYFEKIMRWFGKQHPFAYPFFVVFVCSTFALWYTDSLRINAAGHELTLPWVLFFRCLLGGIAGLVAVFGLVLLAGMGAWKVEMRYFDDGDMKPVRRAHYEKEGRRPQNETYGTVYWCAFVGFCWMLLWAVVFCSGWALTMVVLLLGRKIAFVFRYINSSARVLSGTAGTLGGLLSPLGYFYWASGAPTITECILIVLFGAVIGAMLGVLCWELFSKRRFGMATQT